MNAKLVNLAARRREEWTPLAVPFADAQSLPHECIFKTERGLYLRAVKKENVGTHSTIFLVRAPYGPEQEIVGQLLDPADVPEAMRPTPVPYKAHEWVSDDAKALIPRMTIRLNGQNYTNGLFKVLRIESGFDPMKPQTSHFAHQRWHVRAQIGDSGYLFEGWITFYHDSPIADVRIGFVWSDRTSPSPVSQVDAIVFHTGEIVKFDFALRNGSTTPIPKFTGAEWINEISGSLGFIDGSGLPLMGRMLCLPQRPPEPLLDEEMDRADPQSAEARVTDDIDSLFAAGEAPTYGVCADDVWDGKWLAHRNVARVNKPQEQLQQIADNLHAQFGDMLEQPGHIYDIRPIGTSKSPGRTGDQEDFNATKGWMSTYLGDPRWIHYASYSVVADFFRGVMHYEEDGSRLDPREHLDWTTWSGYTHWHTGQSSDRLGKRALQWGERESTTWLGFDDQHRSQNNLAAVYALTGDPLLRFIIEHYSTSDLANVRHRNNFGTGAPRAVGRTMLTWAHFLHLTDPSSETHQRYLELRTGMKQRFLASWLGDGHPGEVDILYAIEDPRTGTTWNGEVVPSWVVWEHGLMMQGIYAMWKFDKDADWLDITRRVSRTIVKHATIFEGGYWNIANNVYYPTPNRPGPVSVDGANVRSGDPIPREHMTHSSTLVNSGGGGVDSWAFPATLMFIETLDDSNDPDLPTALGVIGSYANSKDSPVPRTAEWYACVRAVVPKVGDYQNYA